MYSRCLYDWRRGSPDYYWMSRTSGRRWRVLAYLAGVQRGVLHLTKISEPFFTSWMHEEWAEAFVRLTGWSFCSYSFQDIKSSVGVFHLYWAYVLVKLQDHVTRGFVCIKDKSLKGHLVMDFHLSPWDSGILGQRWKVQEPLESCWSALDN